LPTVEDILEHAETLAATSPYDASRFLSSALFRFQGSRDEARTLLKGAVEALLAHSARRETEFLVREYIRLNGRTKGRSVISDICGIYVMLESSETGLGDQLLALVVQQGVEISREAALEELELAVEEMSRSTYDSGMSTRLSNLQALVALAGGDTEKTQRILNTIREKKRTDDPLTDFVIQIALGVRAKDDDEVRRAQETHRPLLEHDVLLSSVVRLFRR